MKNFTLKNPYFWLFIIVFIQCCVCTWAFGQREGLFIDELWTFNLANSDFFPMLGNASDYFGIWLSKDFFLNALTANQTNKFAYAAVWFNQAADVHPPLYYAIIHTVCSFFPNFWNERLGLVVNLIFFVGTQLVLFQLAKELTPKKSLFAFLICILYGCSIGAINTVITVRMYMMLTFFTVLSLYLNMCVVRRLMEKKNIGKFLLLSLFLSYLGGVLTQYLFVVPLFFASLFVVIVIISARQIKLLFFYTLACLGGVLSVLQIFPAAWEHTIGGGYRGNQAISLLQNSEFWPRVQNFWKLISESTPADFLCILVVLLLLYGVLKIIFDVNCFFEDRKLIVEIASRKFKSSLKLSRIFLQYDVCGLIICLVSLCSILVVSRITVIQDDRYLMYLFPIVCLALTWAATRIGDVFKYDHKFVYVLIVLISLSFMFLKQDVSNLKWNNAEYKTLNSILDSSDGPEVAVYVDKSADWWPVMEQVKFFIKVDRTLMVTDENLKLISFPGGKQKVLLIISRFSDPVKVQNYLKNAYPSSVFKHTSDNWHGQTYIWEF